MQKTFCLFSFHQNIQLGVVIKEQKKWEVQNSQGKYNLTKNSILLSWQQAVPVTVTESSYLEQKQKQLADFSVDILTIYELCEQNKPYTLPDLASFVLPSNEEKNEEKDWEQAFFYCYLLQKGQNFFSHHKGFFEKKSEQERSAYEQKQKQLAEIAYKIELEENWAGMLRLKQKPTYTKEQENYWLDFQKRLIEFSAEPQEHPEKDYFQKLFLLTHTNTKQNHIFLEALQCLQINISWSRWRAKQTQVCEKYSETLLSEAETLKNNYPEFLEQVVSETHLACYSIDNSKTKDFDDAISIEKTQQGYAVRLHISDLASFITTNSALFSHLADYISSVYTLDKVYHLMPAILSTYTFSLVQDVCRRVMSFAWFFDEKGKLLDSKIYFSKICVRENITYKLADAWIAEKPEWIFLNKICQQWSQQRQQAGALYLERTEIQLDISDKQKIQLFEVNTSSPAYTLVSELAIQANTLAANRFVDRGCIAIFRKQAPYKVLSSKLPTEKLTLDHLEIPAAYYSLDAGGHYGLGVEQYSQITSPIRRFSDLLGQKILSAIIQEQDIPFQDSYLLSVIDRVQNKFIQYSKLEKEILGYWKLQYLAQNKQQLFTIKPLRKTKQGLLVIFLEVQLAYSITAPFLEIGEVYQVRIKEIHWQEKFISLTII